MSITQLITPDDKYIYYAPRPAERREAGRGAFLLCTLPGRAKWGWAGYILILVQNSNLYAHTKSRKCHFLRQLLLLKLNPVVVVTTCLEHTRSRKCVFFRQLLLHPLEWGLCVLNVQGPDNAIFLGKENLQVNFYSHISFRKCYFLRWLLFL